MTLHVSVPVSSTNLVIPPVLSWMHTAFQSTAVAVFTYFAADLTTFTKGWPAWLALLVAAALEYLKTKYLRASNDATIKALDSLATKVEAQLEKQAAHRS